MENDIYVLAGLGVVTLLVIFALLYRLFNRPGGIDMFDDELTDGDDFDDSGDFDDSENEVFSAKLDIQKDKKKPRKKVAKRKKKWKQMVNDTDCSHNYEVTGFPADKLGTHVNLKCTKCDVTLTVTVAESHELLKQRDDVLLAIKKAREAK